MSSSDTPLEHDGINSVTTGIGVNYNTLADIRTLCSRLAQIHWRRSHNYTGLSHNHIDTNLKVNKNKLRRNTVKKLGLANTVKFTWTSASGRSFLFLSRRRLIAGLVSTAMFSYFLHSDPTSTIAECKNHLWDVLEGPLKGNIAQWILRYKKKVTFQLTLTT